VVATRFPPVCGVGGGGDDGGGVGGGGVGVVGGGVGPLGFDVSHQLPLHPTWQLYGPTLHQSPPWTSPSHVDDAAVPKGPQLQYPLPALTPEMPKPKLARKLTADNLIIMIALS